MSGLRAWVAGLAALAAVARAGAGEELLVWVNGDKGYAGIEEIGRIFEENTGVSVKVEHPDGVPDRFVQATQSGKGPDILIWAHDRLGEWADAGLLMPVDPSPAFRAAVFDKAWEAFTHKGKVWAYPIAMEATTLLVNTDLLSPDEVPANLADCAALSERMKEKGALPILWDYSNSYFTWGFLAAGGGEIFGRTAEGDYDPTAVGVDGESVVAMAATIQKMIREGTMPTAASYSVAEALMAQGRLAMFVSGPFAWDNLRKSGIPFAVARLPGVGGEPGRPFVGVLGAMANRFSDKLDLAQEFLEQYLITPTGLAAMDRHVAIGVPARKDAYRTMSADPNIRGLMSNIEVGTMMPNIPEMGAFWSSMVSALNLLTSCRDTPEGALGTAARRMRAAAGAVDEGSPAQ